MNFWELIKIFILCIGASLAYALLMKSPKKSVFVSAVLAGMGYVLYLVTDHFLGTELPAYFAGTLFIAIAGEIMARIFKTPSTIFVFPAVIPLVPGFGLYRAMLKLVQNDYDGFLRTGTETIFIAGVMAVAIALTNFVSRRIFTRREYRSIDRKRNSIGQS